jgi:transcription elongation GreA/GreB family factor
MSRAFVKEQDDAPDQLPERPVSPNPNLVTSRGLARIDAEIEGLRHDLARAQAQADKDRIARLSRDLRYWMKRRGSAQLVPPPQQVTGVAFSTRVTILRDGKSRSFEIVGEDEADPARGLIAYTSPVARALLGKEVGDVAEGMGGEMEIVAVAPIGLSE